MKHIHRILCLLLSLCLLAACFSCQSKPDSTEPSDETPDTPDSPEPPEDNDPTDDVPKDEGDAPADKWTRVEDQSEITDFMTLHGRTYMDGSTLRLFWTYSGFSLRFEGTGVSARLTTSTTNPSYYGYLNVYVDGALAPANTVCVNKNDQWYQLIDGLDEGVHTIEVRKRNEAVYGESATIGVRELSVKDGQFIVEAPEEPKLRIEFIGDSITSGFGNMVTDGSGNIFTTATEDGTMTYATLTGRALNADVHVISRSGICYVTGSNRDSIFNDYSKTAALPGHQNCTDSWDFEAEPNDVVVINLGTNDSGATIGGKQITSDEMKAQAIEFIHMVRKYNPDALIVWAYGMMDQGRKNAIRDAVDAVNDEGDENVFFSLLPLQNKTQNGVGVHGHPTVQSHILAAEVLSRTLAEILDEKIDGRVLLDAQIRCIEEYRLGGAEQYESTSYDSYLASLDAAQTLALNENADLDDCLSTMQELRDGLGSIVSIDDVSDEYIVIDTCDKKDGWSLNGQSAGIDTATHLWGKGCFTTTGTGDLRVNFIRDSAAYGIVLPDDWTDWYLDVWIYLDYPIDLPSGSDFEISQQVDKVEIAYTLNSLSLKQGWNHVVVSISAAGKANIGDFKTLNYLRIFWRNLTETITFKVDDITLSKGKFAADRAELDELLEMAEEMLEDDPDNEALMEALSLADMVNTQRSVDLLVEKLTALIQ